MPAQAHLAVPLSSDLVQLPHRPLAASAPPKAHARRGRWLDGGHRRRFGLRRIGLA